MDRSITLKELITYILREAGVPCLPRLQASTKFGEEAEAGVRGKKRTENCWGFWGTGRAGQSRQFRIG